jgi:hypothetical protein
VVQQRHRHPVGEGIEKGNLDMAPASRPPAGEERLEDRLVGIHARRDVGHRYADTARCLGCAGDRGEARFGLYEEVVSLALPVGLRRAVTGEGADDEPRVLHRQALRREAETFECAGLQVFDQNVGVGNDPLDKPLVVIAPQVGDERFLTPVEPDEISALALRDAVVAAREVAARSFDLDDARAGIGHPAGTQRRGHRLFQAKNEESV